MANKNSSHVLSSWHIKSTVTNIMEDESVFTGLLQWSAKNYLTEKSEGFKITNFVEDDSVRLLFAALEKACRRKANNEIEKNECERVLLEWCIKTTDPFGVDFDGFDCLIEGVPLAALIASVDVAFDFDKYSNMNPMELFPACWKYIASKHGHVNTEVDITNENTPLIAAILCYLAYKRTKSRDISISFRNSMHPSMRGGVSNREKKKSYRASAKITGRIVQDHLPRNSTVLDNLSVNIEEGDKKEDESDVNVCIEDEEEEIDVIIEEEDEDEVVSGVRFGDDVKQSDQSSSSWAKNRKSLHSRVGTGLLFTNEGSKDEKKEKQEDVPAKKEKQEKDVVDKFKFEVKYPLTLVHLGEDVTILVNFTYEGDDEFVLQDDFEITARVRRPDKKTEKIRVKLQKGSSQQLTLKFAPDLIGIYKCQVYFRKEALQNRRCHIRVLEASVAQEQPPLRQRAATSQALVRLDNVPVGISTEEEDEDDEPEIDNEMIEDPETGKKKNWRKSARFRKGEALQFSNVTRGRSNTQALPQDITQLKPKILLTRVNVTVLYPRQKLIIGEPLVAEVTLVDSITNKILKLYKEWSLQLRVDFPDDSVKSFEVKEDPATQLNYAAIVPETTGVYRAQVIFNAYPIQNKRCRITVSKAPAFARMMTKKVRSRDVNDILADVKSKKTSTFAPNLLADKVKGLRKQSTTAESSKDEIVRKKTLMEMSLGHTVRVGGENSGTNDDDEVEQKRRLMEASLGAPVKVRGRGSRIDKDPDGKKKGKAAKRDEEIQEKKELMELLLGEKVEVQQVDIGVVDVNIMKNAKASRIDRPPKS